MLWSKSLVSSGADCAAIILARPADIIFWGSHACFFISGERWHLNSWTNSLTWSYCTKTFSLAYTNLTPGSSVWWLFFSIKEKCPRQPILFTTGNIKTEVTGAFLEDYLRNFDIFQANENRCGDVENNWKEQNSVWRACEHPWLVFLLFQTQVAK